MLTFEKMCIRDRFEQLLRADRRNAYYTEFLPIDPDKADQDLRDVLAHGLMDEADKQQISTLLQSGRSNSEIAYWLSRACLLYTSTPCSSGILKRLFSIVIL